MISVRHVSTVVKYGAIPEVISDYDLFINNIYKQYFFAEQSK